MRRMPTLLVGCVVVVAAAAAARGDDWPNWRGPSGAGVAAGGGYVASWGPQENVRWRVPLPGLGGSPSAPHTNCCCRPGLCHHQWVGRESDAGLCAAPTAAVCPMILTKAGRGFRLLGAGDLT
jgi:hypothetical protein